MRSSKRAAFALIFALVFAAFFAVPLNAQERAPRWFEGFFAEGGIQNYFTPGFFSELIDIIPGFRAALGYEYRRFRFAIESGHTRITGTNPLVLNIQLTPLIFKAGYLLPIYRGFGLQADLNIGRMFSQTTHYEDAIYMIMGRRTESFTNSALLGTRLYATWRFPNNFFRLYAGGGLDFIFETEGTIPMPLIEAGISLSPFMGRNRAQPPVRHVPVPLAEIPEEIVFENIPENIVVEETEEGRIVRLLNAVYFEADSIVMIERFRPILHAAGEMLRENPLLHITLRGYAAPFGELADLMALSAARARYCADYLVTHFGIAEERISIEYFGAERAPEIFSGADWESFRCVELIIK